MKRFICWALGFSPVLSLYGHSGFTIFDAFLLFGLVSFVASGVLPITRSMLLICFGIILSCFLSAWINSPDFTKEVFFRSGKWLLYISAAMVLAQKVSLDDLYPAFTVFIFLLYGFLTVQLILMYFRGFYLPGFIEIGNLRVDNLVMHAESNALGTGFRPRSLLGEPSEIGFWGGIYLYVRAIRDRGRNVVLPSLLMVLLTVATRSATGVLLMGLVFILLLAYFDRVKHASVLALLGLVIVVNYIVVFNGLNDLDLMRRWSDRFTIIHYAPGFFQEDLQIVLFGFSALGDDIFTIWPSGLTRIIFYYGVFGLVLVSLFMFRMVAGTSLRLTVIQLILIGSFFLLTPFGAGYSIVLVLLLFRGLQKSGVPRL